jgi:hypothetical protein
MLRQTRSAYGYHRHSRLLMRGVYHYRLSYPKLLLRLGWSRVSEGRLLRRWWHCGYDYRHLQCAYGYLSLWWSLWL